MISQTIGWHSDWHIN